MRLVVAVLVLVLAGAHANARADDSVGLVVSGGADLQGKVTSHLSRWLARHGYTVADDPLSDDAITTITNCLVIDDAKCASAVVDARAKTPRVLFVRIDLTRPDNNATFTTYWFGKGKPGLGTRKTCEKCTGDAWHGLVDTTLDQINGQVAAQTGDRSHLAEREVVVPPPHKIRRDHHDDDGEPSSRVVPFALLGTGIACLGGSAVFFYYGAQGGSGDKYVYRDATSFGIGLAVLGAGATIGGTVLLRQSGGRSAPVASVGPRGAYVGWVTRF